jgi:large subunit ribosomal protein LP0
MPSAAKLVKKEKFHDKLIGYLKTYTRCFIVHADNVGSNQFMHIRAAMRAKDSQVLMGKNTMIKRSLRIYLEETGDTTWEPLLDIMVGNVGLVFTNGELVELRDMIESNTRPAPAKVNAIAPCDVSVPAGNTGMGPEATSFFQVLNIATKINKGTVEILNDVIVVREGERVNQSAAVLLSKMKITPFEYGLVVTQVFDQGSLFDPKVLSLTDADLLASFSAGCRQVAALSLGANTPTLASVPHSFVNSFKNVLAIAVETEYSFPIAVGPRHFMYKELESTGK